RNREHQIKRIFRLFPASQLYRWTFRAFRISITVVIRIPRIFPLVPSLEYELPLDLIRHFPALAPCLLEHVSATPLPEFTRARCDSGDAATTAPPELRADSVVVLERPPDSGAGAPVPVLVIVVECQRRPDERKRF